ncbi:hypothetical protein BC940DRAFT_331026 [Gongronella butleri]|nr:hypothetical protein BC940DRAFT_331026 [Gongronella butleri]
MEDASAKLHLIKQRVAAAIASLIASLPCTAQKDTISEIELSTGYIDLLLRALFDNSDEQKAESLASGIPRISPPILLCCLLCLCSYANREACASLFPPWVQQRESSTLECQNLAQAHRLSQASRRKISKELHFVYLPPATNMTRFMRAQTLSSSNVAAHGCAAR